MPRLEVPGHRAEEDSARRRDVVAVIQRARLGLGEGVRERLVPLLARERDGTLALRDVEEYRCKGPQLVRWGGAHALGRRRVERNARGADAAVEEQLHESAAGRVPNEDGRRAELADGRFEVGDDLRDRECDDRRWVGVQRLDFYLEAGVGGGKDAVALGLVVCFPVLPAAWRDPEPMDEDDRVGVAHRYVPSQRRTGVAPLDGAQYRLFLARSLANFEVCATGPVCPSDDGARCTMPRESAANACEEGIDTWLPTTPSSWRRPRGRRT